jgi:adenosylcobinamide-GDP ribazoletransferase
MEKGCLSVFTKSDRSRSPVQASAWASGLAQLWRWLFDQYREFVAAVRFLSTVPVPGSTQLFQADRALIFGSAYFPLVGLLLALLLALVPFALGSYLPPLVLAALLVITLIVLTGGLHLDGLMDTCDGLFGGRSRERKLEIMRDSRVGSFGILGGLSILLLKFALFASLNIHVLPPAVIAILPISRWAMVFAVRLFPSTRPTGLGAAFRQTVSLPHLLFAAFFSLVIALIAAHLLGLVLWFAGTLVAILVAAWATHHLGGLTGDIYGTIAEVSEVTLLLIFVVLHFLL